MPTMTGEGQDPRARDAAEAWQHRFGREGHEGSYARHDETYRAFRERHIAELDRDYDEWCRANEQRFHSEFGDWRSKRRAGDDPAGLQPGYVTNDPGDPATIAEDRAVDALVPAAEEGGKRSRRKR